MTNPESSPDVANVGEFDVEKPKDLQWKTLRLIHDYWIIKTH